MLWALRGKKNNNEEKKLTWVAKVMRVLPLAFKTKSPSPVILTNSRCQLMLVSDASQWCSLTRWYESTVWVFMPSKQACGLPYRTGNPTPRRCCVFSRISGSVRGFEIDFWNCVWMQARVNEEQFLAPICCPTLTVEVYLCLDCFFLAHFSHSILVIMQRVSIHKAGYRISR